MWVVRQVRQVVRGSKRPHPYLTIVGVYSLLLLLSRLAKVQLRTPVTEVHKRSVEVEVEEEQGSWEEEGPPPPLPPETLRLLTSAFKAADFDGNKLLSRAELSMAISRQTKQHMLVAMRSNFKTFFALDRGKKNGQVDWEEYYQYFLLHLLHLTPATIASLQEHPASASREIKESISWLRASWHEAARSNPESVNIDEFLALEHPESSHMLLMQRVEELLANHDVNNDGKLTREEYCSHRYKSMTTEKKEERGREFEQGLDANHDGVGERREVIQYMDAKHLHWAKEEARGLLEEADTDEDGMVDVEEMVQHADIFILSKLVNPQMNLHGEF